MTSVQRYYYENVWGFWHKMYDVSLNIGFRREVIIQQKARQSQAFVKEDEGEVSSTIN